MRDRRPDFQTQAVAQRVESTWVPASTHMMIWLEAMAEGGSTFEINCFRQKMMALMPVTWLESIISRPSRKRRGQEGDWLHTDDTLRVRWLSMWALITAQPSCSSTQTRLTNPRSCPSSPQSQPHPEASTTSLTPTASTGAPSTSRHPQSPTNPTAQAHSTPDVCITWLMVPSLPAISSGANMRMAMGTSADVTPSSRPRNSLHTARLTNYSRQHWASVKSMVSKSRTSITLGMDHLGLLTLVYRRGPRMLPKLKELVAMVNCQTSYPRLSWCRCWNTGAICVSVTEMQADTKVPRQIVVVRAVMYRGGCREGGRGTGGGCGAMLVGPVMIIRFIIRKFQIIEIDRMQPKVQVQDATPTVYISNFPKNTEKNKLLSLLKPYGTVLSLSLIHKTNFTFAFAEFRTSEEAGRAIKELDQTVFDGMNIKLQYKREAKEKNQGRAREDDSRSQSHDTSRKNHKEKPVSSGTTLILNDRREKQRRDRSYSPHHDPSKSRSRQKSQKRKARPNQRRQRQRQRESSSRRSTTRQKRQKKSYERHSSNQSGQIDEIYDIIRHMDRRMRRLEEKMDDLMYDVYERERRRH